MTIQVEAFIDLENALIAKVRKAVAKETNQHIRKINKLIKVGAVADAATLINTFDLSEVMASVRPYARTISRASFFMGVSRITEPRNSVLFKNVPKKNLDRLIQQFETAMTTTAAQAIRDRLHKELNAIEVAVAGDRLGGGIEKTPTEVLGLGLDGIGISIPSDEKYYGYTFNPLQAVMPSVSDPFLTAGSSLVISRSNTFGFIEQALIDGVEYYRINEVMDSKTCPVCEQMNGKIFDVQLAAQVAMQIMATDDPEELKQIAPWPKQSFDDVAVLSQMSDAELVAANYIMPPFHPWCRGILEEHKGLPVPTIEAEPDRSEPEVEGFWESALNSLTAGLFGFGKSYREDVEKYDPNQPRWPKGHPSGGQWLGPFTSTLDMARKFDDPDTTPESVLETFDDPDLKQEMLDKRAELEAQPHSIDVYKIDGEWTEERAALHDKIFDMFMTDEAIAAAQAAKGEKPEYITLGGRPASGKSWFTKEDGLNLNKDGNYFVFHSDKVLEELTGYTGDNASLYHKEAKEVANDIVTYARDRRMNLVVEGTMKNAFKVENNAKIFKEAGYDISGFYMHLPRQEAARRTVARFKREGRYVPMVVVLGNVNNEKVFDSMIPQYKRYGVYDNQGPFGSPVTTLKQHGMD